MPNPSPLPAATVVARLSTDGKRAQQIGDLLAESFDAEEVAASAFEQPDGRSAERWPTVAVATLGGERFV